MDISRWCNDRNSSDIMTRPGGAQDAALILRPSGARYVWSIIPGGCTTG